MLEVIEFIFSDLWVSIGIFLMMAAIFVPWEDFKIEFSIETKE